MRICTFNVNSIKTRKDLILEWLAHRENDIDILCFQELKALEELFPHDDFKTLGYSCFVSGQKAYNGVAICTKLPAERILEKEIEDYWDEQKRIIAVRTADVTLFNIYAPHGDERGAEKFHYKMDWYDKLRKFLEKHFSKEDPLIAVGDFNIAREDRDVWSPEELHDTIGTMPEEREKLEALLDWGTIDSFRRIYPEKKQFTWWGYIGGAIWRDQGMRIDYVLCTKSLIEKVKDVEVDLWPRRRRSPKPSDHAPLIATMDVTGM